MQAHTTLNDIIFDYSKLIVVDGANGDTIHPAATDVSNSDVAGSKFVKAFKSHMFYAGKSSNLTLRFEQPFDEDAFGSGRGV